MADIDLLGTLAPPAGGTLPITRGEHVMGVARIVANAAARDAIATTQLRTKDLCLLADTGIWYQWSGASWGAYTGFGGGGGGGMGFPFTFSATTTDADPGAGTFRANNAAPASATQLFVDDLESGGTTVSAWLATFDDVISSGKGTVRLQSKSNPLLWLEFPITAYTSATGYSKITVGTSRGPGGILTTAGDTQIIFDAGATGTVPDASLATPYIKADGTRALTATWAVGNQSITGIKSLVFNGEVDVTGTAVDWTTGQLAKKTSLAADVTLTFTDPTGPSGLELRATQDVTGGRKITLPGSIIWLDGVTWQANPAASSTSVLGLKYIGGGVYLGYGRALDSYVVTEASTARTFGLSDSGAYVRATNAAATTLSVPTNASAAFAVGALITGIQAGAGQVTIVAVTPGTTTINKSASRNAKTFEQYSCWSLKKVATDAWDLCGDLEFV